LLDVSDCLAVVVGGGAVGARKATGLIDAGARRVRVVSPAFHPDMPAGVERVAGRYQTEHLHGARLVFAATDSADVNGAVVADARRLGIWVNRADADDDLAGDFTLPANLRDGPVLIAVSAGGSPALAATIRDELRGKMDRRWAQLADAMQTLRPRIRAARQLDPVRRRTLLRELASAEALAAVSAGGADGLWRWAAERYPELDEQSPA
jgi:siroheme synthase-like protein